MSHRNRLVASVTALLRGQQGPGALGRSHCTPRLVPRLSRPLTPYIPSHCISFSASKERQAQPREKTSPLQLDDSVPAETVAQSPARFGRLIQASEADGYVKLNFEHHYTNTPANLSTLWFRDSCLCDKCMSESSGQKRFATCDIDENPQVESCRVTDNGDLQLVWANDRLTGGSSHTSVYPQEFLQQVVAFHGGLQRHWRFTPQRIPWDKHSFEDAMDALSISYEDWMAGGEAFAKAFLGLHTWGLIFLRGVPESHDAVQDIASKIGSLQLTFYGLTWDVISKPNAENVAYTNEFLCLHQDLLYWRETPKIQLLHCLKNECEGGESLFSDGLRTALELKTSHENLYNVLAEEYANFHYSRNGNFYYDSRHIIEQKCGSPVQINWAPPFQAPFTQDPSEPGHGKLHRWREAARVFRDSLETPANMLQHRLQPGECVLFDNQRILHGRTKFNTSAGLRHLRGGYIDTQTLTSAFVRLGRQGALGALDEQRRSEHGGA